MNAVLKLPIAALLIVLGASGCADDEALTDPEFTVTPKAYAGPDISIPDTDDDGVEKIILDGCASEPGGRPITSYDWYEHGVCLDGGRAPTLAACQQETQLDVGLHTITLIVSDGAGVGSTDDVDVEIFSLRPDVFIVSPFEGSVFAKGTEVRFSGGVFDAQGAPLDGDRLVWTSSLDGTLGSGVTIAVSGLTVGEHQVTLTATDTEGYTGTASTTVRIAFPPVVTITAPLDGAALSPRQLVTFEGSSTDEDGNELDLNSLNWRSDRDGLLGTGLRVLTRDLSLGLHQITLSGRDADGLVGSDTITVEVSGPAAPFTVSFELDLLPFFDENCVSCHGDAEAGGIRLDSHAAVTYGGNANGPLIVPGDPGQGILIPRVLSDHHYVEWWWGSLFRDVSGEVGVTLLPAWVRDGAPDN